MEMFDVFTTSPSSSLQVEQSAGSDKMAQVGSSHFLMVCDAVAVP